MLPLAGAVAAFSAWFGSFFFIERLQLSATARSRSVPWRELVNRQTASRFVLLTAVAAAIYAFGTNVIVVIAVAGSYGVAWAISERGTTAERFAKWPMVPASVHRAVAWAAAVAHVASLLAVALTAITVVNLIRA
jgi:hypothetical protein